MTVVSLYKPFRSNSTAVAGKILHLIRTDIGKILLEMFCKPPGMGRIRFHLKFIGEKCFIPALFPGYSPRCSYLEINNTALHIVAVYIAVYLIVMPLRYQQAECKVMQQFFSRPKPELFALSYPDKLTGKGNLFLFKREGTAYL